MIRACWCCMELRKHGYKGCLKTDFRRETTILIGELLVKINSPRARDYETKNIFVGSDNA